MWHFVPKALPVLVHAPGDGGYPAEAALNKDKLELGKALRHPFDDQAGELTGNRVGVRMVLFVVVGRPAASRWRVTAIAADMDAERQVCSLGGGIERPIATPPQRFVGTR